MLPLRARRLGARALLCPANLAPLASRGPRVVVHDAAALRDPGWYSGAYAAWQRRAAARDRPPRARTLITVSEFSRARAGRARGAPTRRGSR